MRITCAKCERAINIPDEKLPKDKVFVITCPGCKNKIKVEDHLKSNSSGTVAINEEELKEESVNTAGHVLSTEFEDDEEELAIYDEDVRMALVLDEQNQDAWTRVLEEKEYKVQYARSPEHAVHKMRLTHFDLVGMHENYGGLALQENPVYRHLQEIPMATRRNIFFALTGSHFKSLDNIAAFSKSVNVVVSENDMGNLNQILKKSINENDAFYKVFKETLRAMGKV